MASSHNIAPESLPESPSTPEHLSHVVQQPTRLTEMVELINLVGSINERVTENHAQYAGSSGAAGQQGQSSQAQSARDLAIANLPQPQVMQQQLMKHINAEIHLLKKQAKSVSAGKKKGWACELNELYSKMRRLSAIASQILRASAEIVRRFYILVFIDRQPLVRSAKGSARPA